MLIDTRNNDQKTAEGFNPTVQNQELTPKSGIGGVLFIILLFLLAVIPGLIFLIWCVCRKNYFNRYQIRINEGASNIDIQYKQRKDTLVKLVDATKSSMKFEKDLLTDITQLRSQNNSYKPTDAKNIGKLDGMWSRFKATFENYPKLQSVDAIRDLMSSADYQERELAASRRLYNSLVRNFNQELFTFPTTIVSGKMKLHTLPLIVAAEEDKKDVNLSL